MMYINNNFCYCKVASEQNNCIYFLPFWHIIEDITMISLATYAVIRYIDYYKVEYMQQRWLRATTLCMELVKKRQFGNYFGIFLNKIPLKRCKCNRSRDIMMPKVEKTIVYTYMIIVERRNVKRGIRSIIFKMQFDILNESFVYSFPM